MDTNKQINEQTDKPNIHYTKIGIFLGFKIVSGDPGVEIMSDLEEGIFGWVTVNFLLDKLGEPGQEFLVVILRFRISRIKVRKFSLILLVYF